MLGSCLLDTLGVRDLTGTPAYGPKRGLVQRNVLGLSQSLE